MFFVNFKATLFFRIFAKKIIQISTHAIQLHHKVKKNVSIQIAGTIYLDNLSFRFKLTGI